MSDQYWYWPDEILARFNIPARVAGASIPARFTVFSDLESPGGVRACHEGHGKHERLEGCCPEAIKTRDKAASVPL